MKKLFAICMFCLCLFTNVLSAAPKPTDAKLDPSTEDRKHVIEALSKISKVADRELPLDGIELTPIPDLLQVTSEGSILYISKDGKYLISGELIDLSRDRKNWNLTEIAARQVWQKLLAQIPVADMIVYPASKKKIATVTVFTDIDCGYCRKMQHNIDEYSDAGIEVRYLAFPRSGPGTASYDKAVTVWCSKDRAAAYDIAMTGKDMPKIKCDNNPVYKELDLGRKIGVTGTPTIFLENGMKIPGMVNATELVKIIEKSKG